jgi:hypothetical protein
MGMRRIVIVLALASAGCLGQPFTTELFVDAGEGAETGPDRGVPADSTKDSGGAESSDAGGGDGGDGSPREAAAEAGELDAGTCEPFSLVGRDAGACFGNSLAHGSVDTLMVYGDAGPGTGCGETATPPECQCLEEYNCACLAAHQVVNGDNLCAGAGAWAGCQMIDGLPVIDCR